MRNIKFRAVLVFLIILLFVGTSVTSVTNGGIEKNNNISKNKVCNNYFMSTNSLLAYWSFDEGTGSVANDYSGNGYYGIIYGATWTTGYSGSALDFDGSNDYVNLDAHSQNLAFNNTDDYKISAWIKSTSTDEDMIYEISNPTYELPVFYLKMNTDGILNSYVSSTSVCWVEVYSTKSYNDGQWHYIECIYHGSESEPTLELYVDEELVDSDTDYLCPMDAEQFNKAKIGKSSYDSTDYFDGVVDEVKVYKKPEGNQPPNAPIMSGPTLGTVGQEYNYLFVTTDPDGEKIFYWVDWGDNYNTSWIGPYNSNEEISLDHIWSEEGTYLISAKAKDEFDVSEWSSSWVTIENQDPNAPSITGPPRGKAGTPYDYYFTSIDPDGHDVQYFVDWGDDNTEWTDFVSSGTEVKVSHTWSKRDTYVIKAKAKDAFDAESDLTTLSVTMPRNRAINGFFLRFLEQFPILQRLLRL